MLEYTELDNRITKSQLNKTFPNNVNIGFGLDANKIKGVNNFPIYSETDGFISHAKQNVDSFMFHSTNKYNVAKPTHTSVGEIQPYYYDKKSPSNPKEINVRMKRGEMSSLYGLPPDRDIILENPTGQAMGSPSEEEFRVNQLRKSVVETSGGLPSELQSIVNADTSPTATATASEAPTATATATETPQKIKTMRIPPVVSQAFEIKTPTKDDAVSETSSENKKGKAYVIAELDNFISTTDISKKINDENREILDKILTSAGFRAPKKTIKNFSTYVAEFRTIVETNKKINWIKELESSKKKKLKLTPKSKIQFSQVETFLNKVFKGEDKSIPSPKKRRSEKTVEDIPKLTPKTKIQFPKVESFLDKVLKGEDAKIPSPQKKLINKKQTLK